MNASVMKKYLIKQSNPQFNKYWPTNPAEWNRFNSVYGMAYQHIIADSIPPLVHAKVVEKGITNKGFRYEKLLLERAHRHDWIPAVLFQPSEGGIKPKGITLIVSPAGKLGIANSSRTAPNQLVQKLLKHGQSVMAIDVFKTGEHILSHGVTTERDESKPHFTTYNKTDTQQRIQDILTAGKYLQQTFSGRHVNLLGLHRGGIWGMLAAPIGGKLFAHIICSEDQIDLSQTGQLLPFFIGGLAKYGGVPTALALTAEQDTKVTIYNVNPAMNMDKIKTAYRSLGRLNHLSIIPGNLTTPKIANILGS
jgi:dienelactone hydrolase